MALPIQIIFDLDDTLIHSFDGYSTVHQETARALGLPVLCHDELVLYDKDFPSTLHHQYGHLSGFDPQRFIDQWDLIADAHPYRGVDGVHDALKQLIDAGHDLWIVTSRSARRLFQRMTESGLEREWFRGIFPREDQPQQKPHPSCFEPVWQALGARPGDAELEHVFYVGDRECDQLAAAAAGVPFIAVRTGPEVRQGFPRGIPNSQILDTVADVPRWLRERRA